MANGERRGEGDGRKDNLRIKEVIEKKMARFGDFSISGIR